MRTIIALAIAICISAMPLSATSAQITDKPYLIFPLNGGVYYDNTPTFSWSSVAVAENYEIQYSSENSFAYQDTVTISDIRNTSVVPENALNDGVYFWRVRLGRFSGVIGAWSDTGYFMVDATPEISPTQVSPADNGYSKQQDIYFEWQAVTGVSTYRFTLDNNEEFATLMIDNLTTSLNATISGLVGGKYYWKVASVDSAGNENYSSVQSFTIDNQAPEVTITSPVDSENINDTTPLITWEASDDYQLENFELSVDGMVVAVLGGSDSSFGGISELQDGIHTISIRASDSVGNENTGATITFEVDTTPPEAPSKLFPENGTRSIYKTNTVSWLLLDHTHRAVKYELWVDDNPDFTSTILLENFEIDTTSKEVDLPDGTSYWRVRAYDNANNVGGFEDVWEIFVDNTPPSQPTLSWPTEGVVENTSRPTFSWQAVSDASGVFYNFELATENDFSVVVLADNSSSESYVPSSELPDRIYWWRAKAVDNSGHVGEWSENYSFDIIKRDFNMSISPTEVAIEQGSDAAIVLMITRTGKYDQEVLFDMSGHPTGVNIGLGSITFEAAKLEHISTRYMSVAEGTATGDYTLTMTASDANDWQRTATINLRILRKPDVSIDTILASENKSFTVNKAGVIELSILASSKIENAGIYVSEADNTDINAISGNVYSYIQVTTENISDQQLGGVEFKFSVDRYWINQNKIDNSSVSLWRYESGAWTKIPTQLYSQTSTQLLYRASSPGLSVFAVTGQEIAGFPFVLLAIPVVAIALVAIFLWRRRRAPKETLSAPSAQPAPQGAYAPEKKPEKKKEAKGDNW